MPTSFVLTPYGLPRAAAAHPTHIMRKLLLLLLILLAALTSALPAAAVKIGDLYYDLDGDVAYVTYLSSEYNGNNNYVSGDIVIPSSVEYAGKSYTVTRIGSKAFYQCTSLKSVVLPGTVKYIDTEAFRFSSLNSINLDSVIVIYDNAFNNCKKLTSISAPALKTISAYGFFACSALTTIDLPNVTSIGDGSFNSCAKLSSVKIGKGDCSFGENVFLSCKSLFDYEVTTGYTYFIFTLTKMGDVQIGDNTIKSYSVNVGSKWSSTLKSLDSIVRFNSSTVAYYSVKFYMNIGSNSFYIESIPKLYFKSSTFTTDQTASSLDVQAKPSDPSEWNSMTLTFGDQSFPSAHGKVNGLSPNTSYTVKYVFKNSMESVTNSTTVKTAELEMETQAAQAMNTTTALLAAKTNLDDEEVNVGFEWRRNGAPSTMPSSKVYCAQVDGELMGALTNLNPEVYYDYRPFYTANDGTSYYGDWVTLFTGDANVYFDPTVRTFSPEVQSPQSVTLKGYALRGSDNIDDQGFEYWVSGSASSSFRASSDKKRVSVDGQRIAYTLSELEPETTYTYCTYVTTAKGTFTGTEETFTTPAADGIETIITDVEATEPVLIGYYTLQGVRSDRPFQGLNIVVYSDGTSKKILIK